MSDSTTEQPSVQPRMSPVGRLLNVLAAPGEVFSDVVGRPVALVHWLVPLLTAAVITVVYCQVAFSQPAIVRQVRDTQESALQAQVREGKLSQEQADQAMRHSERFFQPGVLKISGSIGGVVAVTVLFFAISLGVWLLTKWALKSPVPFMKAVEVNGLASVIQVLGGVVATFLVAITGNMQKTLGPALLIRDFDLANKGHLLLASVNLMTLWYIAVLAIGVGRVSGKGTLTAAVWLYGIWIGIRLASVLGFGWAF